LLPPVLLSDFPSRVQSSVDLCSSGSGLTHRQAVPSAGSVLVRSGFEDYQFGKHGASSGGAGHAEFGRPSGSQRCFWYSFRFSPSAGSGAFGYPCLGKEYWWGSSFWEVWRSSWGFGFHSSFSVGFVSSVAKAVRPCVWVSLVCVVCGL